MIRAFGGTRIGADLSRAAELVAARGGMLGRPLHVLASTPSTNDEAKHAAKAGAPHGATWIAEEQTAGRGRQGRTWTSSRGESLLVSVLLRVACPPSRIPPIAVVAGLAVRDAVAAAAPGARVMVKWPNDVVVADGAGAGGGVGRKVAGVLVEGITAGSRVEAVIVGFGINVHTREFPDDIAGGATSVALASSAPPDRAEILADVLSRLDADLHVAVGRGLGLLRARLEACDALRGRRVRSDGGDEGVASGIDDDGRLVVTRPDGVRVGWNAGEVHLLPT